MSSGGSDAQLISQSLPYVTVQIDLCVRGHMLGCFAAPVIGADETTQAHPSRNLETTLCDEFRRARAGKGRRPATSPRWRARAY